MSEYAKELQHLKTHRWANLHYWAWSTIWTDTGSWTNKDQSLGQIPHMHVYLQLKFVSNIKNHN